ncbi:MAG: hypothetical protein O7D91_08920 [Planctomycetota bacterium]|nr:hypothetical protein [Planctomycetota bacterium]
MCIRASRSVACILLITTSASAEFVGVTIVTKDDPDTEFLCTQGNGKYVPGPLTVCNAYAAFDDPADRLLSVGFADLQVYNGAKPDVFFHHPLNATVTSPTCFFVEFVAPDLICDTFITVGYKCAPAPAGFDQTSIDGDFDAGEFNSYGHIVGGWFNASPSNGQGNAGTWPDLQVLFLQSSVAQGLSLFGDIHIFWLDGEAGEVFAEVDVPIECAAACPDGEPCDDGDACNGDETCVAGICQAGTPLNCDDVNLCTTDDCDPLVGCVNSPVNCDDSDACTTDSCDPLTGLCVHDPINCNDNDICTTDDCDPIDGCFHTHNSDPCDDGDACTEMDECSGGVCSGVEIVCEPGEICDEGVCVPMCFDPADCDDLSACTQDLCNGGLCSNSPIDCDDGNPCTEDSCDAASGCISGDPVDCNDGNACTDDSCDSDIGCVNDPIDCDDSNECTDDYCDPDTGLCVYINNDSPCDDGDACTVGDRCDDGCVHGMPINCDDGNACTIDSCDPAAGCFTDPVDCDDEDACTEDDCDSDTGCTHQAIECPEGQICDPASGECVEIQDPCECVNGKVTLCHIPQGNRANAHTITVGCAARARHLAHGDVCGPCE